jgi:hypothetical protein
MVILVLPMGNSLYSYRPWTHFPRLQNIVRSKRIHFSACIQVSDVPQLDTNNCKRQTIRFFFRCQVRVTKFASALILDSAIQLVCLDNRGGRMMTTVKITKFIILREETNATDLGIESGSVL